MNIQRFTADERGVSEVVGAILVFALVVALLGIIQSQAVPNQNQEVEVQHSVDVQGDMVKYHQIASQVATSGNEQSVAIETGTGYPARLLFFNPPRVQGTLETSESREAKIKNIQSTEGEVDDYISGDQNGQLALDSRTMLYRGNYNEYQNPPVIKYEYGILYNEYEDASVVANPGTIIDGTDINLLFLAGEYAKTSSTTQSVGVQPVSAPARTVPIESDGSGNLNITLQSDLPVEQWKEAYDSQYIIDITRYQNPNTVEIQLDDSETYDLRMSQIALKKDVEEPKGYYIVPTGDGTTSVTEGETTNVKFEVRDEYNNPVSNVPVVVESPPGTSVTQTPPPTTNTDGKITVPISPDSSGTQTATAYIQGGPGQSKVDGCDDPSNPDKDERCQADFTLQVTDLSINPGSGVRLDEAYIDQTPLAEFDPGERDNVTVGEENTNIVKTTFYVTGDNDREIAAVRMNVYSTDQNPPTTANMTNSNGELVVGDMEIGGEFKTSSDWKNDPETLVSEEDTTYGFRFYKEDGSPRVVKDNDYFVITVVYKNDERAIYFVSPDGNPND
jgi:FlaG/FlaF family flagellin (archaellin)